LKVAKFWKHSLGTGAVAKLIAKSLGVDSKTMEEYFICGLLHDIGKIILEHNLPDEYEDTIKKIKAESGNLVELETELLGINHCEVGKILVDKWQLSDSICQVIQYHHSTEKCSEEYSKLVYSVAVANTFCNRNEIGYSGNSPDVLQDTKLLSSLSLTEETLDNWRPAIFQEIERASIFLNIK
jgi:putative nucleotidyltransferase with HDIG domain